MFPGAAASVVCLLCALSAVQVQRVAGFASPWPVGRNLVGQSRATSSAAHRQPTRLWSAGGKSVEDQQLDTVIAARKKEPDEDLADIDESQKWFQETLIEEEVARRQKERERLIAKHEEWLQKVREHGLPHAEEPKAEPETVESLRKRVRELEETVRSMERAQRELAVWERSWLGRYYRGRLKIGYALMAPLYRLLLRLRGDGGGERGDAR
ncbi:unnamed protein product [Vitrella brassicaformis CCMP3155]|uniref:Uncharacterized protein n=1 Tax=Vitrella brassicaformis (strain CCMP3155) TaxID=1169540 RepID=A0A0G4FZU8_VITBC|nr:unnamed protein product [Vitrella brassicaformis CCMP3155]|eukprot:CEM21064.1 unnamed protein product [Vitrella brassicaformis CCMP3155]